MHTQFQAVGQSGATIPATAKPEKKTKDISGGANSNIFNKVVVGLKGTRGTALKRVDWSIGLS